MNLLLEQILAGISTGCIYACMALAIVVTYKSSRILNFAQGEMAMVSCYIALVAMEHGFSYWNAFVIAAIAGFLLGFLIEIIVIKPVERGPTINAIIVTIGIHFCLQSVAGWLFTYDNRAFQSPFPAEALKVGEISIPYFDLGIIGMSFVTMTLLWFFFQFTNAGLAMRAAAFDKVGCSLLGIRTWIVLAAGWGVGGIVGAIGGMLVAPVIYVSPGMMLGVMIYGIAAAILGGLESPGGAVVGGIIMGVVENLVGAYIPYFGTSLKLTIALVVILSVLVFRPNGLFGHEEVERV